MKAPRGRGADVEKEAEPPARVGTHRPAQDEQRSRASAEEEGWYYAPHGLDLKAALDWEKSQGDLDWVSISLATLQGRALYSQQDPDIECMAVSRDGCRLYVQDLLDHRRRRRTITFGGGETETEPGSCTTDEAIPLGSFRSKSGRLLPSMSVCAYRELPIPPFLYDRPLERTAGDMTQEERLAALKAVSEQPASLDAFRDVLALLRPQSPSEAEASVQLVSSKIAKWPKHLRQRPEWLPWLAPHPAWELIAFAESWIGAKHRTLDRAALERLTQMPIHAECKELELIACGIGPSDVGLLAAWPAAKNLDKLSLEDNPIGDEGALELSTSPHLNNLSFLYLSGCGIGPEGARALAASPNVARLRTLHLRRNLLDEPAVSDLLESPYLFGRKRRAGQRADLHYSVGDKDYRV